MPPVIEVLRNVPLPVCEPLWMSRKVPPRSPELLTVAPLTFSVPTAFPFAKATFWEPDLASYVLPAEPVRLPTVAAPPTANVFPCKLTLLSDNAPPAVEFAWIVPLLTVTPANVCVFPEASFEIPTLGVELSPKRATELSVKLYAVVPPNVSLPTGTLADWMAIVGDTPLFPWNRAVSAEVGFATPDQLVANWAVVPHLPLLPDGLELALFHVRLAAMASVGRLATRPPATRASAIARAKKSLVFMILFMAKAGRAARADDRTRRVMWERFPTLWGVERKGASEVNDRPRGEAIPCPAFAKAPAPRSDEMGYPCTNRVLAPTDCAIDRAKSAIRSAHFWLWVAAPSRGDRSAPARLGSVGGGEPGRRCGRGRHVAAARVDWESDDGLPY